MKQVISRKLAGYSLIVILSLTIVFHLLVVSGLIPYEIVWGGRIQTRAQMLTFELVSITLNLLMLGLAAIHMRIIRVSIKARISHLALWLMCGLFTLNTIGNLIFHRTASRRQYSRLLRFYSQYFASGSPITRKNMHRNC